MNSRRIPWNESKNVRGQSLFDLSDTGSSSCRLVINPLTCALGVDMAPLCKACAICAIQCSDRYARRLEGLGESRSPTHQACARPNTQIVFVQRREITGEVE